MGWVLDTRTSFPEFLDIPRHCMGWVLDTRTSFPEFLDILDNIWVGCKHRVTCRGDLNTGWL